MSDHIEFTDRYGGNYPNLAAMCQGQCEGMGVYPQHKDDPEMSEYERQQVMQAVAAGQKPDEIGYFFITCSDCAGTGKRADP